MKLWIDAVRPAPEGYYWVKNVYDAVITIEETEHLANRPRMLDCNFSIELIDIAHDAGHSGEYSRLLDWLKKTGRSYHICTHSTDSAGIENKYTTDH